MIDKAEILRFLTWLYPSGPWLLTAIDQNQVLPTRSATFRPESQGEMIDWIQTANSGQWNIYYSLNEPTHDMTKKAERDDIARMNFLHVDVDPRVGEKLEDEHERILKKLTERRPATVPRPSCVVFSGGGYNALWRLEVPVPIASRECTKEEVRTRYEEAKRYNLQLEIEFGADHCHNIDRILRMPGTVNWPNKKKREKGRVPTDAKIVYIEDTRYPLAGFVAAQPIQSSGPGGTVMSGGVQVQISGNVKRLGHVNELGDKVSDKIKMIIVQGFDPDEPNRHTGRSEWLFWVVCELVRAGVTDDTIYSVITDPDFLISQSVLDKGSSVERYATRQIQRARENAIDPALRAMNERHAVIGNMGGKCRIIEEQMDHGLGRWQLTSQSFEDFRNRYMHEKIQVGQHPKTQEPVFQPKGAWWLQHANRRQFETLVFVPGKEVPDAWNMWRGFACEARPGSKHTIFLDHMRDIVCDGSTESYEYLLKWMARAVQHPDTQGETCVVFRGPMGAGKGTVATQFGKLWGRHFLQVSDPKHLVGSFNAHLRDAVVVFADEAFYAGDKKHESILKTMITEALLAIEGKGKDVITSRNYVHLMMASNSEWVVPVDVQDRRYFVIDVPAHKTKDRAYWDKLYRDMDDGGRENLLHYLLTLDLAGYQVRNIPQTKGLREQKLLSLSTEQEWWYQKLLNGSITRKHIHWTAPVWKDDLHDEFLLHAQKLGVQRRSNATFLGKFLNKVCPPGYPRSKQLVKQLQSEGGSKYTERHYAYEFPPLQECRKWFDEKFGGPYEWQDEPQEPNGVTEIPGPSSEEFNAF